MEEKTLSEKESLTLIGEVIGEAKNYFYETGLSSLILGFSTSICFLLAYAISKGMSFPFNPFYLVVPAVLLQGYFAMKEEKRKPVKTFTDRAIDMVWSGYFLTALGFTIAGVLAGLGVIIFSVLLFLTGFASFVTGAITKFSYLIVTSLLVLGMGALSFFVSESFIYVLCAITSVLVWIIPGFILRSYFKKAYPHV